ncbi:YeeE/YedE family protein [Consotaella salsifontis]|uniref:Uncharacterized protein n=1 Tax=Consotaella salsifontis TaxID=1365950 RepID=A0A1T4T631_9HYPH|nr:YeeE/YedE family protein [Consotaella salsifontis]SKA35906.1 hypothetical protein SAMN05428963_1205 [Consotaella salsifontis]
MSNILLTHSRSPAGSGNPLTLGAIVLLVLGAAFIGFAHGALLAALFIVGAALGVTLYHAAFGFTGAWRAFIVNGRGEGLRAQMLMLAVGVILFFPVLDAGQLFGAPVRGYVSPVGLSVIAGSFMFGLGMQLGGGCASGTLFTVGGGNARMVITLLFFCVGSVLGTVNFDWWTSLPHMAPISLVDRFGAGGAMALSLLLFALVAAITVRVERDRHGSLEKEKVPDHHGMQRVLRGPWPVMIGGVLLALLNFLTLALAGKPWGITSAFALWGAKGAMLFGVDPTQWFYWQQPANAHALASPVLADVTSVMDIGIILGAMIAAMFAGRFAPNLRIPLRSVLAAAIGGILLGYGARIAYGCNIGAYFGGVVSGSVHGWLWLVFAFLGNMLGVKLRPFFFKQPPAGITKTA